MSRVREGPPIGPLRQLASEGDAKPGVASREEDAVVIVDPAILEEAPGSRPDARGTPAASPAQTVPGPRSGSKGVPASPDIRRACRPRGRGRRGNPAQTHSGVQLRETECFSARVTLHSVNKVRALPTRYRPATVHSRRVPAESRERRARTIDCPLVRLRLTGEEFLKVGRRPACGPLALRPENMRERRKVLQEKFHRLKGDIEEVNNATTIGANEPRTPPSQRDGRNCTVSAIT